MVSHLGSEINYALAIHPSASIARDARLGEGTVVMAKAAINASTIIGKHVIINTGAVVEHDVKLADFVHISPNAALAGGVEVGEGTQVGIGASVIQNVKIGKWCTIGAGAVIIQDVPDHAVVVALGLFLLLFPLILILVLLATWSTQSWGLFSQSRIGLHGKPFQIYKIRTMRGKKESSVTTAIDPYVTPLGRFFRKTKLDELPQLINVLKGEMSFVGPRPDVAGFADGLEGEDRIILSVKPGITGPASLDFRNEEELLAQQEDPEDYNRKVIWPKKVEINKEYVRQQSFTKDLYYLWKTLLG
ncbi:unnamed protein product [Cyprideis torosa]|uniref:Uncharacterized protein n=1 Tax=Cyprideis torosa TaxID=163714 RepID=A0A7R8WUT0_9CRUS|nr:unnamed protein product [Cyprideis torosa]CAG0906699.1 unnamed protein product [Cyprideis torosa]